MSLHYAHLSKQLTKSKFTAKKIVVNAYRGMIHTASVSEVSRNISKGSTSHDLGTW